MRTQALARRPRRHRTALRDRPRHVDLDAYAEHVAWLAANGCDGVIPTARSASTRRSPPRSAPRVVETAVEASPDGFIVMPGVAAYGAAEARRWAEQAAEAGAPR